MSGCRARAGFQLVSPNWHVRNCSPDWKAQSFSQEYGGVQVDEQENS